HDHPRRADRGLQARRRRAAPVLRRYGAAVVAHQHRGALRHPLHLRLEPISLALADHHARQHGNHRHRHQEDHRHLGRLDGMEHRPGDRDAGDATARRRRRPDAALVRQRPGRNREITMASVTLENVKKRYAGGIEAVKGISLAMADGSFTVLLGPSGCGKSTLLRMIAGLETVSSGTVSVAGRTVNDVEPADRDIAMVFQNYALYPHMTAYD